MAAELLIGVDLGTTALKAGVFDEHGAILASAQKTYAIERPLPGWAEQSPQHWMDALADVLAELAPVAGGRTAVAIGICSQVNTHVFVDEKREPLRPAIVWQDQRCGAIANDLNVRFARSSPEKARHFSFTASSMPSRAQWIAREEPDIWAATRYVLAPKDFVTTQLCRPEVPATDPITPFDVVDDEGTYDDDVVALVDGVRERLPQIRPIDAVVGTVVGNRFSLLENALVVTGTMDAWGSVYGSGVTEHGDAMEVAGTSEILGLFSRERHATSGVVSFLAVDGLHLHAGPTQAGGAALAWFASLSRLGVADVVDLAAAAPPGSDGLIFMPHLLGERAPLWDSEVRGAFLGLSSDHTLAHLCRAVLEGVAYSARHLLEALEEAGGVVPDELRASGGGSQSDLWSQIKADVFDRPVARLRIRHSGCLGAALMAASGAGLVSSVRDAARTNVQIEQVFEPQPHRDIYDELYSLYRDLYRVMRPTHAALAALRRRSAAVPT
jgi:xylulokinase